MSASQRAGALAASAVVLACGLSGCTDSSSKPEPLQSPSLSPELTQSSASASPSGAPTLPAAARGTSKESAEAFARYYVDLINYAIASGQSQPMRQRASQGCRTCNAVANEIEGVYRTGGRMVSKGWAVLQSEALAGTTNSRVVRLQIRINAAAVYESPSDSPSKSGSTRGTLIVSLAARAGDWTVKQMVAS